MDEKRYPKPERRYVSENWVPNTWKDIQPLYKEIEARTLNTGGDLESWLLDLSEVDSIIGGVSSRRYFASTCDTSDEEAEKDHLEYQMSYYLYLLSRLPEYKCDCLQHQHPLN